MLFEFSTISITFAIKLLSKLYPTKVWLSFGHKPSLPGGCSFFSCLQCCVCVSQSHFYILFPISCPVYCVQRQGFLLINSRTVPGCFGIWCLASNPFRRTFPSSHTPSLFFPFSSGSVPFCSFLHALLSAVFFTWTFFLSEGSHSLLSFSNCCCLLPPTLKRVESSSPTVTASLHSPAFRGWHSCH